MKALTVRQPWATLIALGEKTIETRPWTTAYRGRLAIHAGKSTRHIPAGGLELIGVRGRIWTCTRQGDRLLLEGPGFRYATGDAYPLPLGAVVAHVHLDDIARIDRGPLPAEWLAQSALGDFAEGRYAWLLSDAHPIVPSASQRGQQGLWNL